MSTTAPIDPIAPVVTKVVNAPPQDKFAIERVTQGGVTLLTLHGTLDHEFEGRKVALSVPTKKLVVNMRDVRRFASWGMSEWMDFLRISAERDLYLIECSTYAVSQINLVTGLLGHGKLVSFYASYNCAACRADLESLFIVPRDRAIIPHLPGSHLDCASCGGRARLEEYPAAFFDTIAERPLFDVDDEVLEFLRARIGYHIPPDLTRFRAYRRAQKTYTYLRVSGSVGNLPADVLAGASAGTTVLDLEGVVFDPADVRAWRTYVQTALPELTSMQLLSCPPGFLEHAVLPEDLHDRVKIRTFALSYDCVSCDTSSAHLIDVAENLEQLVGGTVPASRCPTCQAGIIARVTPELVKRLRSLPARDRDPALDRFLAKSRGEPTDKLENCLVAGARKKPPRAGGARPAMYVAAGLSILVIAGLAVVAAGLWTQRGTQPAVAQGSGEGSTAPPAFVRPDWIISDVPASAQCHDLINRLMCVGVSSFRATRDEALSEANEAALDELVNSVGLKISDPFFRERVLPGYSEVRATAMSALQAAEIDRGSAAYLAANEVVRKARARVVEILRISGGAAVPSQRSDWYWEEYAGEHGKGNEIMVFVRYDVALDATRSLVERYSASATAKGATVMTAFPALAWQDPEFTGGVAVTKPGKLLGGAGIDAQDLVVAIDGKPVSDATAFMRRLEDEAAPSALTVKKPDGPAQVVELRN